MVGDPATRDVFVPHGFAEQQVDLGEITMNYAEAGSPGSPALLLIPEQTGSWWGYEEAMRLLAPDFHVYAVDLRGQGRSTWTPQRYSLDNFGNDLVRFITLVVQRPVIAAGNSSGGLLAAWLSAYAMPGQIRGALCEDAPFFASELVPAYGHSIRQAAGVMFELYRDYLGDQLLGALSDFQAERARSLMESAGVEVGYVSAPDALHMMHQFDPPRYTKILTEWASTLPAL
jgi:pimeloyl-ACP methyl ester carboxylesterase